MSVSKSFVRSDTISSMPCTFLSVFLGLHNYCLTHGIFHLPDPRWDWSPSDSFIFFTTHRWTWLPARICLNVRAWHAHHPCSPTYTLQKIQHQGSSTKSIIGLGRQCTYYRLVFQIYAMFILTLSSICILLIHSHFLIVHLRMFFSCFPVRTGIPNLLWLVSLPIFKSDSP